MAATALKYISPLEYLEAEVLADEKHEYFDGRIIAMAGAREAHNRIVGNLIGEIHSSLKGKSCDVFPSDFRVTTPSSNSYMYPDVSIVCDELKKREYEFDTLTNPSVVIEVMSNDTRKSDEGYTFFYYKEIPSLYEYILVDSVQPYVHSICKQKDDVRKFERIADINSTVSIQTIDLSLSLKDIYNKITFKD
jgi:Uma2 family endonuclease